MFFLQLIYLTFFLIVMVLIMSMNFYVDLSVAIGHTIGYFIFHSKHDLESKKKCHWEKEYLNKLTSIV